MTTTLGTTVRFVYNGKVREGVVDRIGEGPAGEYMTLNLGDDGFKSFTVGKMTNFMEVSHLLGNMKKYGLVK